MICRQCRQIDTCSLTYVGTPKAVLRKAEGEWGWSREFQSREAVLEQPDPPIVLNCCWGLSCGRV